MAARMGATTGSGLPIGVQIVAPYGCEDLPSVASYRGMSYRGMVGAVKVDKLSVSFDADLGDAVRAAAKRSGRGLSRWLADAATARLRAESLAEFLETWEAEHGALTPDELARAAEELGLPQSAVAGPAA